MKNQLDYSNFIERYIDGEMGQQELIWFKKEIESDESLQREIKLRHKINDSLAEKNLMSYRNELEEVYQSINFEKPKSPRRVFHPAILGSILTIVIVGVFLMLNSLNRNSSEYLFKKYYQPYETSVTYRSSDANYTELSEAMEKYHNRNFEEALVLFEKILKNDPSKVGLNFYSGISQMEMQKYSHAGNSFMKVIQDQYNMYYEQAEWYLALCYLVTENSDKAILQFENIASEDGFYSKKAKRILRKIR